MGVKDILAGYDEAIDEALEDAQGYHDAVTAIRHDAVLEQYADAGQFDQQQVSQMAQEMDKEADVEEGVPFDEDPGYSMDDLDTLDRVENTMQPRQKQQPRRKQRPGGHKLAVVVPGSRLGFHVEIIVKGRVIAHKPVAPSRKARQVTFDGLPTAKVTVRLLEPVVSRTVPLRASGRLDLRPR